MELSKDKWMHRWYWKIAGAVLMVYVLIGGMITPLKPGIESLDGPLSAKPGDYVELKIKGYNAHYVTGKNVKAWLKLDDNHIIPAVNLRYVAEDRLIAMFILPPSGRKEETVPLTLVLYNTMDGPSILPDAISILPMTGEIDPNQMIKWHTSYEQLLPTPAGIKFPYRNILHETIRNTFFHVALWLSMVIILLAGLYHAIFNLRTKNTRHDKLSASYNSVAILYGLLGLATGSIWARFTWGTWWTTDIKLNMAAIAMLIYAAYFILRSSITDFDKRARFSAVYSIFAFVALIPLIFVIPRLYDSLHPGNGGNPALGGEDLDNTLRLFFYPSIIGMVLLGVWMATLSYRYTKTEEKIMTQF